MDEWPDELIARSEQPHALARYLAEQLLKDHVPRFAAIHVPAKATMTVIRDDRGVAQSYEMRKTPAYRGKDHLPQLAKGWWSDATDMTDILYGRPYGDYMIFCATALGHGPAFLSRLKTLAASPSPQHFWSRAFRWSGKLDGRIRAKLDQRYAQRRAAMLSGQRQQSPGPS